MKPNKENPAKILDQAIDAIRQAPVSADAVEQAAERVRHRLQEEYYKVVPHPSAAEVDRIQSCTDFRALIPAYLTASLTSSRRLLFEDHVRECVGCRKALDAGKRGASVTPTARPAGRKPILTAQRAKWIVPIAAALLVAVGLQIGVVRDWVWPIDVHAVVQMVDGGLFKLSGHDVQGIKAGERIERGQAVRTGLGSGAMLQLADGTRIEMAAKSELSLTRARDGVKIKLARGNVIVSAAKQHGHLYVETGDCNVSVVGTVFSVSSTIKGSRVAVVEGEVLVEEEGGTEETLLPGEQTFTDPAMGMVPIEQEIGWSRNAEAMLKELQSFGQDFASRVERESMRHTSKLVGLVPADTVVFASLPNVAQQFKDSYALFRQRVGENTTLAGWWQDAATASSRTKLDEMANRIADVGAYLGSEVVAAFSKDSGRVLLVAEADRPDVLVSALEADLQRIEATEGTSGIRLARNPEELAAAGTGLVIYVGEGLMIASDGPTVQRTAAINRGTVTNTFSGTPLYGRLAQAYNEGVGWLLAVDLRQLVPAGGTEAQQLGFENVQQLVLEQKTGIVSAASQVSLGFSEQRRGLPAWLGAPAPMGALDFVSSDAYGFSAWITKDPELILDDILNIGGTDGGPAQHLSLLAQMLRIDLRRDLAEPLGNEVLVAIDGPVLPTPSWKVVFEVNDAPRLENTIQWVVTNVNRELEARQLPTWSLESETVDGKTYHALKSMGAPTEFHYTSWMGYMIFAPSRALVADAIRIHDSGTSINRSAAFRDQLPPDGHDTASAIMYQNLQAMSNSVTSLATDVGTQEFRDTLRTATLFQSSLPKAVFVYGEQDRILASAKGSFGVRIASMIGMSHLIGASGMWDSLH